MRKRAQRRRISYESTPTVEPTKPERKKFTMKIKKDWWIPALLISIFFLVLLLNTYFNVTSGFAFNPDGESLSETYYLSGPDPYYNMRLVEGTLETGKYPYYSEFDPILNYPIGTTGRRAPLLNMMAIGFSRFLVPFMDEADAVGYSMQFIPALFGALLVIPVFFIGKELFGKKAGIIAALLIAIIPIHLGSGHGSGYSLFDHDSFNLLLFFLTFLFLIKGVKEKDAIKSMIYAVLSGVSLAALSMTWVEAQFLYVVISIYAIGQMLMDIFTTKIEPRIPRTLIIVLCTGYLISLPVILSRFKVAPTLPLYLCIGIILFAGLYLVLGRRKIPWVISIPTIIGVAGVVLGSLYVLHTNEGVITQFPFLSPLKLAAKMIYGQGIYGLKVSQTIAEASTSGLSRTVISFGPVIYWLGWAGFVLLLYFYVKEKWRRDYLFIIILFYINLWLAGTAGRFINDSVPVVAILGGWVIWLMIDRFQYNKMMRDVRHAGGGFRGLRRGMNVFHLFGIFFVVLLVMVPNAFLSFDAAVPTATSKNGTSLMKVDYFGQEHQQAFGSGLLKEQYWVDAFDWLNEQDLDIEDPTQRPAFISWWDYGFYASAVSGHPTVADNFQSGIPPAANFHTARNEKEAVAVLTIRLMEGDMDDNDGVLSSSVVEILEKHLGENETVNVTTWMENPELSPSYNAPIGAEYDKNLSEIWRVAEQWDANAYYHDVVRTINETLDDEGATWLYHDIQGATGNSIRYYGVEGYDRFIFNIFAFLSDKSIYIPAQRSIYIGIPASMLTANPEDDFKSLIYTVRSQQDRSGRAMYPQHDNKDYSFAELKALNKQEQESVFVSNIREQRKEAYYETMVYNVYMGNHPFREQEQYKNLQLPCWGMKHFYAEYISTKYPYPGSNPPIPAVVIAKYYEGAFVNGTVTANNTPLNFVQVVCFDQYGIPHDNILTDAQGKFKLMVPAGNITIQLSYLGEVPLTSVTFNSTNDTMYSPITDDEAMRLTDNYTREINITVDLASIDGYIYEDINNNGSYEPDVDMPLSDVTVQPRDELGLFRNPAPVITDETGYYSFKDLFPSKYIISVLQDEFELHGESIPVTPGYQSYNVSKPQPGDIEGTVFFDTNNTGSYDPGEEMSGVTVDLFYQRNNRLIDRITTEHTGNYSFRSLIPGEYLLNATVQNTTTGYLNYIREEQITIEENTTTSFDIQLDYATISVSGHTTYETTNIANMSISFSPDPSVENNTATHANAKSDTEGFYRIRLDPGTYNLIVSELVNESGIDVTYSFSGNLTLAQGLGIKTFDIRLARTEE